MQLIAWLLLLGCFSLRFVALSHDPVLVSPSGMYLTDEGWYSKAAQNFRLLGHPDASSDFVPITHTFGEVGLCRVVFDLFGQSLLALRAFHLLLSGLGIFCLCWSIRARWGQQLAYCLGLGLLCNLLLISLTRLALPDTSSFALLTLALAARIAAKQHRGMDLLSLGLAISLSFVKTSYLPVTLWLIWMSAQTRLHRERSGLRSISLRSVSTCILSLLPLGLGYVWIYLHHQEAWAMFSELNLQGRMVQGPLQWLLNLGYALGADLWSTGSLGLSLFTITHARSRGVKSFIRDPHVKALGLLLGLNFLARSMIWYHPPRYGLVTALVILLLSLIALKQQSDAAPSRRSDITRKWMIFALVGQLPLAVAIAQNGYSGNSMQDASEDFIQAIRKHPEQPKILYGSGSASFVSLFSPELRAVDVSDRAQDMCERVSHYGPGFLMVDDRKEHDFELRKALSGCPDKITLTPIRSHQVLNNYYRQGPWRLFILSGSRAPTKQ